MATRTKESAIEGPAPGRPNEVECVMRYCSSGALKTEETCSLCPAIAVPTIVKMPEPITAPIPREVRLNHPSDFFNLISAFSESESSWSMLLQRNSGDPTQALRSYPVVRTGPWSEPDTVGCMMCSHSIANLLPHATCATPATNRTAVLRRRRRPFPPVSMLVDI